MAQYNTDKAYDTDTVYDPTDGTPTHRFGGVPMWRRFYMQPPRPEAPEEPEIKAGTEALADFRIKQTKKAEAAAIAAAKRAAIEKAELYAQDVALLLLTDGLV